jgi:hypothetical protein
MNSKARADAMLEFVRMPEQLTDIDNLAGKAEPCIAYHRMQSDGISYFNSRGQLVTKHYGKTAIMMEITRYHYAEALKTQDNPPYFNEWARNLHLAHMYSNYNSDTVSRTEVKHQSRLPLFPPSAPVVQNRLPHRPKETRTDSSAGLSSEIVSKRVRILSVEPETECLELNTMGMDPISDPFVFPEYVRLMIEHLVRNIPEDSNSIIVENDDVTDLDPCSPSFSSNLPTSSQNFQSPENNFQADYDSHEANAEVTTAGPCSPSFMATSHQ